MSEKVNNNESLNSTKNVRFNSQVFYCSDCGIPLIRSEGESRVCPICGMEAGYLSADIRPVFPEERLLYALLQGEDPASFMGKSIWAADSRYYVDGKPYVISADKLKATDVDVLCRKLEELSLLTKRDGEPYSFFDRQRELFVQANRDRLNFLKEEASSFVQEAAARFGQEQIVLSFSGGKDSTASADIVIKALSNPALTHLFGDTTLEFPWTYEYVDRYRKNHPLAEFRVARNNDQNFMKVCDDIGPPARMMRWCCSMFKTGPITRVLNRKYGDAQILTFYGVRAGESVTRSKYSRVTENTEGVKIQKQTVASPIFYWKDIDVWLYLLGEGLDFNDAYRLGWDRVGCWCCPNNSVRSQFLSSVYMREKSTAWRDFLIGFAKRIGKGDPEDYVDGGGWKARQGGNGLTAAGDVKLKFASCTSDGDAKIYALNRDMDDSFLNLLVPFGTISKDLGRKLVHETLVLEPKSMVPVISVQPFRQGEFEHAVRIKLMNVAHPDDLHRQLGYQVRKFNACRFCLKCESVCRQGAISVAGGEYRIDPAKCVRCRMCVTEKYLSGGCMMDKYLRTKTGGDR